MGASSSADAGSQLAQTCWSGTRTESRVRKPISVHPAKMSSNWFNCAFTGSSRWSRMSHQEILRSSSHQAGLSPLHHSCTSKSGPDFKSELGRDEGVEWADVHICREQMCPGGTPGGTPSAQGFTFRKELRLEPPSPDWLGQKWVGLGGRSDRDDASMCTWEQGCSDRPDRSQVQVRLPCRCGCSNTGGTRNLLLLLQKPPAVFRKGHDGNHAGTS